VLDLARQIGLKKIQSMLVSSGKWFWLRIIACVAMAGKKRVTMADKKRSSAVHLQKRV
jgi:hypothetical protein